MGFSRPKAVNSEGENRIGGGGGGGSSAKATEWIEASLDPADWTVIKSGFAAVTPEPTLTKVGNLLVADFPTARNYNLGGTTNNGVSMLSNFHLQPWMNHSSGAPPAGTPAQQIQPESSLIKIEVQFEDANGPWNGIAANGYGNYMICVAGLASWATDQAGSPGLSGWIYRGAQVRKNSGAQPSVATGNNVYRAGYKTYFGWADVGFAAWKAQSGSPVNGHDAIVFQAGTPLRRDGDTAQAIAQAGSYAADVPFKLMNQSGFSFKDGSTVFSNTATNCNYFSLWIYFGSHTGNRAGVCKIKRIRYCVQPLPSRTAI